MTKTKTKRHKTSHIHTKKRQVARPFGIEIHHIALGVAAIGTLVLVLLIQSYR